MVDRLRRFGLVALLATTFGALGLTAPAGAQAPSQATAAQPERPQQGLPCYGAIINSATSAHPVVAVTQRQLETGPVEEEHLVPPDESRFGTADNPIIGFRIEARVTFTVIYDDIRTSEIIATHHRVINEPGHLHPVDPCHVATMAIHPSAGVPPEDQVGPWYGLVTNPQWSSWPVVVVTEQETPQGTVRQDHEIRPGQTWIGEAGNPIIGFRIDRPDLATRLRFRALYSDLRTKLPAGTYLDVPVEEGLYPVDPIHGAIVTVYPVGTEVPPFGGSN